MAEATAYLLIRTFLPNPTPLSLPEVTTKIVMMIKIKMRLKMIVLVITKNKIHTLSSSLLMVNL